MAQEDAEDQHEENIDHSRDKGQGSDVGGVLYTVEDIPPRHLCVLLGFQHYLTAAGAMITVPLVLSEYFCMDEDRVGISELISTIFFCSGMATLLQTTFGTRLPIIQGGTFSLVAPTIAILSQPRWVCPYRELRLKHGNGISANFTLMGLPEVGSDEHRELWMMRIREIQGAIMLASLLEVFIGLSGIMGAALKYIGPLSIAPSVTLIGLSLFSAGSKLASNHWWIAMTTVVLIALFSQYLKDVYVPCLTVRQGQRCNTIKLPIFKLFPVLLAVLLAWLICVLLTITDCLSSDPAEWGHNVRTDTTLDVLKKASWFRIPYPGQWGCPTISTSSVFGILAGGMGAMLESVGDYYACARLSEAPPPPIHAVNRGIALEGIGCILAGLWGSGSGTTSYSENIGAIGVTKVGSRRVVQVGGCLMLVLSCFGKFCALFATIPAPVVGGMFVVAFGMVSAVGIANLQYVNMNSSRNLFIVGVSLYIGLCVPGWVEQNPDYIKTGSDGLDHVLTVLLSTSMFVGGSIGFILDNTIQGTEDERGILTWRSLSTFSPSQRDGHNQHIYDIPILQRYLDNHVIFTYLPFCPNFMKKPEPFPVPSTEVVDIHEHCDNKSATSLRSFRPLLWSSSDCILRWSHKNEQTGHEQGRGGPSALESLRLDFRHGKWRKSQSVTTDQRSMQSDDDHRSGRNCKK